MVEFLNETKLVTLNCIFLEFLREYQALVSDDLMESELFKSCLQLLGSEHNLTILC